MDLLDETFLKCLAHIEKLSPSLYLFMLPTVYEGAYFLTHNYY